MFRDKLEQVVENIDGTLACVLIGYDGIPVESIYPDEEIEEMDAIAVELSNLLAKFRRLQSYDFGDVRDISVTIGEMTTLARLVGEEYLLMLVLEAGADTARGRHLLKLIAPDIEDEIR